MRRIFLLAIIVVCAFSASSQIPLELSTEKNGSITVINFNGSVTDNIFLQNSTRESIEIVVEGLNTKYGFATIGGIQLNPGGEIELPTLWSHRLKLFSYFSIRLKEGIIAQSSAVAVRHDLHFVVSAIKKGEVNLSKRDAETEENNSNLDEKLSLLKHWLDAGIITQEEFAAKRKELIGF